MPYRAAVAGVATLGALAAAWAAPRAEADEGPKKVALLVGVNRYKARKLADRPPRYAERDVQVLGEVLRGQEFEVRTLTGAEATKAKIDAERAALLAGRAASDLVLLGFAGHGVQMPLLDAQGNQQRDPRGQPLSDAYFCPADAVFGDGSTMVSLTRLFERLDRQGGMNLVLVDACRDDPDPNRGVRAL